MQVSELSRADVARWDEFVNRCSNATFFHLAGWREVLESVLKHRSRFLYAERQGEIVGVLPLAEVKSRIFGHALVSLPFCVYGGVAANDQPACLALIEAAEKLGHRLGVDYLETGRLTGLLLLASEALVVVFTVFRRAPALVDRSMRARALTGMSILGPLLLMPSPPTRLASDAVTAAVSAIGLTVVIAGKMSLGRSFGLMPANRGIVCTGPYRLVRHPIYMGYLITHVAFLAANPSPWNIVALVGADLVLMARAVCEECTLGRAAEYRDYQTRVRWRVVPGVF